MDFEAYEQLVRWMATLPLCAVAETEERPYLLVHAGIEMKAARAFLLEHGVDCADGVGAVGADRELLQQMLAVQSSDDLLWIRRGYWDAPTGLLSAEGEGPVVVSGHTPTVSLGRYCEVGGLAGLDEESGRGQIVRLGGEDTAGVPDRIDIDCAAATGSEFGRVGILRLDDGAEFYANINPGEYSVQRVANLGRSFFDYFRRIAPSCSVSARNEERLRPRQCENARKTVATESNDVATVLFWLPAG